MILAKLCLALPLAGGADVKWTAPAVFVPGHPFEVAVELAAPEGGATIAGWLLKPAAFIVDGEPLGPRDDKGAIELPSGFKVSGRIDLAPMLAKRGDFKLDYGTSSAGGAFEVAFRESVPAGTNFMQMAPEELASYQVLLRTNRGDVLLKMWPDVAPGHVRNFLDLAYIKFYDGTIFHRVVADFMVQGGDPTGTGTGNGPRTLEAEFSDRRHVRGVLSMARQGTPGTPGPQDPLRNSASCQFFIVVQAESAHLDGGYSAFGEVVLGMDVVDEISTTSLNPGNKPKIPQVIERAIVVRVPGAAPAGGAGEAGGERSGGR
ncbi:MAG TPA: peptidylprolyl isomerase [Planctomycetota bacterium]|nr:peptidylprolyl isomerase [Planctomycetota bacterium]